MIERFKEAFQIDFCDMEDLVFNVLSSQSNSESDNMVKAFFDVYNITDASRKFLVYETLNNCRIAENLRCEEPSKILKIKDWLKKRYYYSSSTSEKVFFDNWTES